MNKLFKLYKYQSLSEEKHFEFLDNYLNQHVWLVPLDKFNDPFEGKCSLFSISPEFVLSNPEIFDGLLEQHHLHGETNLTADDFRRRLNSDEFKTHLKSNTRISDFNKHGALCLTTKNTNIPMWAYYADNHKGYCVEFELDFSGLRERDLMPLDILEDYVNGVMQGSRVVSCRLRNFPQAFVFAKVRYSETIPSMILDDFIKLRSEYEAIEYFVKNSVGVKSSEWKHEDEYRLIVNGNSEECGLLPLESFAPFLKVTGIIFGAQMGGERRRRANDMCQNKKINIYTASCANSHYEVIIKKHEEASCNDLLNGANKFLKIDT